jgi:hypothetical protein
MAESEQKRTCEGCKFALLEDYGYSNYTVEGTTVHCLKRLHPDREGFDRWYGEDGRLLFAERCPGFVAGEPVEVDVEQEKAYPYDAPQAQPWWQAYIEDDERGALVAALETERNR